MNSFLPFLLLILGLAIVLRVDFFFTVLYLFAGVYLLSRWWAGRAREAIRVERRFTDRAFLGDLIQVELRFHNLGWLPVPWAEINESLPVQLTAPPFRREAISLAPRQQRTLGYTLQCLQRGYYPLGPMTVRTGDLLGIESATTARVEPQFLTVFPRIVPLQELGLPTRSPLVALPSQSPLFEDPSRLMGVRDYQRGDSPRRIHWTATASAGRTLVKQYRPAIAHETTICLDLNEENYARAYRYAATELAVVAAASLANHIITKQKLPAGLASRGLDPLDGQVTRFHVPPRAEKGHLIAILALLARARTTTEIDFAELLQYESLGLSWGSTIAVITGSASEHVFGTFAAMRRSGLAVALILIQPGRPGPTLFQRAARLGVAVHTVWDEHDLEKLA